MDLVQNPVLNREGKKWKQRWAVLKKVSPKSNRQSKDFYYYLFLYKDASHAKEGKEKYVFPLDFCGMDVSTQYDKATNVLIIVTTSQTIYLSFDHKSIRDRWQQILQDHYGQAVSYDISIPDKQKLKPGEATIRLYPSFFSIVTNKNYRCLNRWYTNDIHSYSAVDDSNFMFEVAPPTKSKGLVVNLRVPNNAEDVARAFDYIAGQLPVSPQSLTVNNHFHGSAILDELGQARRNVGDQNFFRRVILRASDRMRKKKRGRAQSAENNKRKNQAPSNSMVEEARFRSLDRKKIPDLSVNLDDASMFKTMQIARSQSAVQNTRHSESELAPELPRKRISNASNASQQVNQQVKSSTSVEKKPPPHERVLFKQRSMTTNDIPYVNCGIKVKPKTSRSVEMISDQCDSEEENKAEASNKLNENMNMVLSPTDKSEITGRQARTSAESCSYKHPAKYAIAKTRRGSSKLKADAQKTPTPPPRSPVSLGMQPSMFEFPSSEDLYEKGSNSSLLHEIDAQIKRRTVHSDISDDAFAISGDPSPNIPTNNNLFRSQGSEPIYGNMQMVRIASDSNTLTINNGHVKRRNNYRKDSTKHLSDPLMVDVWSVATGDGKTVSSMGDIPLTDYVNVKGPQSDDDNDSYVNVSADQTSERRKKNKPQPLRLKSYRNEFEKYDDEDSSIYHAVGARDNDSTHSADCISYTNQSDGSYENVNATRRNPRGKGSDYLNLMSPGSNSRTNSSKLNYVMVGKQDMLRGAYLSKSSSTSPVRQTPRSPIDTYNKSDYTRIDAPATDALQRSLGEHQRAVNLTPTKMTK